MRVAARRLGRRARLCAGKERRYNPLRWPSAAATRCLGAGSAEARESQPTACLGHRLAGTLEHSVGLGQANIRVGRCESRWRGERGGGRGTIAGRGWRAALDEGEQVRWRLVWWRRRGRVRHPESTTLRGTALHRATPRHEDARTLGCQRRDKGIMVIQTGAVREVLVNINRQQSRSTR